MAEKTDDAAETAATQNVSGTDATTQPNTVEPDARKPSDDDGADQLGMWKHQARENERKMHENRDRANAAESKLTDVEGELAKANVRIARLEAQRQHPEITDEAFDTLCRETEPEKISAWADAFVKFMPSKAETVEAGQPNDDGAGQCFMSAAAKEALSHSAPHIGKQSNGIADAYRYAAERSRINIK